MNNFLIKNARIVLLDQIFEGDLLVEEGRISKFDKKINKDGVKLFDANKNYLTPGLFELHIHGQKGISFEDLEDKENGKDILKIHQSLIHNGVNTYLPTFSCSEENISICIKFFTQFNLFDYHIPGIYIEGPYINPQKKGALPLKSIKDPMKDSEYISHLWDLSKHKIKMLTFAPELKGIKKIVNFMTKHKIIPSIGHTNGVYKDAKTFLDLKKLNITHLFNAMTQLNHRNTGIAMIPFLHKTTFFELIVDGIHLDDNMVKMSNKYLNHKRMILISDSTSAAGCSYGYYRHLGSEIISKREGAFYKNREDIFVGSNKSLNECIKHFVSITSTPIEKVIRMVTYNPACLLDLENERGFIEKNKKADLVLLDSNFNCLKNFNNEISC